MTPNEQPDAAVRLAEQRLEFAHVYNRELAAEVIALQSHNETLRRALEFYAGRVREDGNGYEFDREDFRGERARQALAATPAEQPALLNCVECDQPVKPSETPPLYCPHCNGPETPAEQPARRTLK